MASYKLTKKVENELENIYEYSIINFGLFTAKKYLQDLCDCFELLAENPSFGNDYSYLKSGVMRYECRSHSIYYRTIEEETILILRVLGKRQDPGRHI